MKVDCIMRTSLIVDTARTRSAYDRGMVAGKAGLDEETSFYKWHDRISLGERFTEDESDAWHAGHDDYANS
jgi:hypothetical protein